MRRALDLSSWDAAATLIAQWNTIGVIGASAASIPSIREAVEKFTADAEARGLERESVKKIRDAVERRFQQFCERKGYRLLRQLGVDELREYRNELAKTYAANSVRGRLGYVRAFLRFCVVSGWITSNPATAVKPPRAEDTGVDTFTEDEIQAMLHVADTFNHCGIHGPGNRKRIRAMILLLRFSGLRISDASVLARHRLNDDKLGVRTLKTGSLIYCPLPPPVVAALSESPSENPAYFFWNGTSLPITAVKVWEGTFRRVFELAGIPDEKRFIHNFRHTFATDLLERGIPIEDVAALLGNSVKIVEKHYSHFVKSRRDRLEQRVRALWSDEPAPGTPPADATPKMPPAA